MKKIPFLFAAIIMLIACDPPKWMRSDHTQWWVKNSTNEPVVIIMPIYLTGERIVSPGDSIKIFQGAPLPNESSFEVLYKNPYWDTSGDQDRRIDILSVTGDLLKRWKYAERENVGKQFFNKSSWGIYTRTWEEAIEVEYFWVLEILQDDISQ